MKFTTQINWSRQGADFNPKTYSRNHHIQLGNTYAIEASSAPDFLGDASLANPEELFSAAISSCFMLTFIYLASLKGLTIDEYQAKTVGTLAKNSEGKMAMTEVIIKPSIKFTDNKKPEATLLDELFKKAHDTCFISCSVKTHVVIEQEASIA